MGVGVNCQSRSELLGRLHTQGHLKGEHFGDEMLGDIKVKLTPVVSTLGLYISLLKIHISVDATR